LADGDNPPSATYMSGYMEAPEEADEPFGIWRKQVALGVYRRSDLYTPAVYRSRYYLEWIVPAQAFDTVGVSLETGRARRRAALLGEFVEECG